MKTPEELRDFIFKDEVRRTGFQRWWDEDWSWDGLAKRKWKDERSLQDYWAEEKDRLITFAGRTWTRFHLPPFAPDKQLCADYTKAKSGDFRDLIRGRLPEYTKADVETAKNEGRASVLDRAFFDGCIFPGWIRQPPRGVVVARFDHAMFLDDADFCAQILTASFDGAQFSGGVALFNKAQFSGGDASFDYAQFSGGYASFDGAQFSGGFAWFIDAQFSGGGASFDGAQFSGGNAWFENAQFSGGGASFEGAQFSHGAATFRGPKGAVFSGATNFSGALFKQGADFSGRSFHGKTDFRNTKVYAPLTFNECELFQETYFDEASFRPPDNPKPWVLNKPAASPSGPGIVGINNRHAESFEKAFRILRYLTARANNLEYEQMFHALELDARRTRTNIPRFERALSWVYRLVSYYGASLWRPLVTLLSVGVVALLLTSLLVYHTADFNQIDASANGRGALAFDVLAFVGRNFIPSPLVWSFDLEKIYWAGAMDPWARLGLVAIGSFQTLTFIACIAMFLIALRRRFQMRSE